MALVAGSREQERESRARAARARRGKGRTPLVHAFGGRGRLRQASADENEFAERMCCSIRSTPRHRDQRVLSASSARPQTQELQNAIASGPPPPARLEFGPWTVCERSLKLSEATPSSPKRSLSSPSRCRPRPVAGSTSAACRRTRLCVLAGGCGRPLTTDAARRDGGPLFAEGRDQARRLPRDGQLRRASLRSGRARLTAQFVEFAELRDAEDAVRDLNGREFMNERITVEFARAPRQFDGPRPPSVVDDMCFD